MTRPTSEMVDKEIKALTARLSVLQRREDDFARVVEDMVRLQNSIRAEREASSSQLTELESQKQPVNWLPSELLTEIFLIRAEDESADLAVGLPYNPAPVLISHVCRKWRELALATWRLWSFISYRTPRWKARPLFVFLERSGNSPIIFNFIASPASPSSNQDIPALEEEERTTSERIIDALKPQSHRVRSFTFECGFAKSMEEVLKAISQPYRQFYKLESLDLALSTLDPTFEGTHLLTYDALSVGSPGDEAGVLKHLRLQQMPLIVVPSYLVRTIRTLELSYPPKKSQSTRRHHFALKMSHLIQLLRHAPQLHELSMIGVTPVWDVVAKVSMDGQLSQSTIEPRHPKVVSSFELPQLTRLEWKCAYHRDIFPFMSLVVLPELERWDLLVAQCPAKRYDVTQFRGNHIHDQDSFIRAEPLSTVLTLHALKELNFSCQNEESLGYSLRQFIFPSLTKLDITFVGQHLRKEAALPSLSRLESIFRDPRLPLLTHLTISNFDIMAVHGRTMLGYMPNLLSLTLGACTGVDVVLDALAEAYGIAKRPGVYPRSCGVRVCPRLEELMLWNCIDFDFKMLWSTVYTRSVALDDDSEPDHDIFEAEAIASAVLGRTIRPLKKIRNTRSQQCGDTGPHAASGSSKSTLIPIEEALRPSRITCVQIEDCPQISEHEALSLERRGTVVMYR
ncbi:hypothetical protein PAXRUDRAFT_136017 [Paxillus rubicundulus Ve08.2h10]|uniref:F-box domain-containing protein n=1 Tax=Paxillus rubicundulus Ve08.2h10 TaxID=930991 RepID=A0A0D0DHC6_9AGAM|nr:hypothetical protein PAXRUDRAFT_136017 [Paxillus rubicundulus Ve08.2h10]